MWMKAREWIVTIGLLALVLAAATGLILTRQSAQSSSAASRGRKPPLVDEQPLLTARALSAVASDWDEQRFSRQALKVADHEVDLAFSSQMRQATEHPAPPTPQNKELFAQANRAQAAVKADQDRVDQLQKDLAGAKPERQQSLQQQLDLAKAQLELDQDDLEDAKGDLIRAGADHLSRIQRQFARHEASQHEFDSSHPQTWSPNILGAYGPGWNRASQRVECFAEKSRPVAAGHGRGQTEAATLSKTAMTRCRNK